MKRTEIPKKIKELRTQLGLTQKQLAEKAGVIEVTVCRNEKAASEPTLDVLERYAEVFGCELHVLFVKKKQQ